MNLSLQLTVCHQQVFLSLWIDFIEFLNMIPLNWFHQMASMKYWLPKEQAIRTQTFIESKKDHYWIWFISIILLNYPLLTDLYKAHQMDLEPLLINTPLVMINFIGILLKEIAMVMEKNGMLEVKKIDLITPKALKVEWGNQDHLQNKLLDVFRVWRVKFLKFVIHKNQQMYKEHGCTIKIQQWQRWKQEKLTKLLSRTMRCLYLLVMEREHLGYSVINQGSIDTKEVKLHALMHQVCSRVIRWEIKSSLENDYHIIRCFKYSFNITFYF